MKKDCPKAINASIHNERLKPMLGGGFIAKTSLRIGYENPDSRFMFFQGRINDQHISMLVNTWASHSFMSPQMVKSLGLFLMRVNNPIKVRFVKGEPQVAGQVVENVNQARDVERGRKFYHLRDGRHQCRLGLDVFGSL